MWIIVDIIKIYLEISHLPSQSFCTPLADEFLCDNITPLRWNLPVAMHFRGKNPETFIPSHQTYSTLWIVLTLQEFLLLTKLVLHSDPLSYPCIFFYCILHTYIPGVFSRPTVSLYPLRFSPVNPTLTQKDFSLL